MIPPDDASAFPVLLLEPHTQNAIDVASCLAAAGFELRICNDARSALQAVNEAFFSVLIVMADLTNRDCLITLGALRKRAPRSWIVVGSPRLDEHAYHLVHRCGGDACVATPLAMQDLVIRLEAFQRRARSSF